MSVQAFVVVSFLSRLAEIQKASIALQNFSSKSVSQSFFGLDYLENIFVY